MILSYDPKLIFVHIPKTAGTSVEHSLKPFLRGKIIYGSQNSEWSYHTTALQFKNRLENYSEFFKFTIVRNPYDRLYSWGCMMVGKRKSEPITKQEFRNWLLFGSRSMKTIPQRKPQMDWIADRNGNILIDYIGRFESLKPHFDDIVRKLGGKSTDLCHKRQSNRIKNYKEMYDNEMIEFVETYHKKDLDYFKYSF